MRHYHGLPITPESAARAVLHGSYAFVSFEYPQPLGLAIEYAEGIGADNGAFTAWKQNRAVTDWSAYYAWVEELRRVPRFNFAVIPDVIDGDEDDNDRLIEEWPWKGRWASVGVPVWHLHESLDRLKKLATGWPKICIGSSGQYADIGTPSWWNRMAEAMDVLCDENGYPLTKIHGLRMLDPNVFTRFPFYSGDSQNIALNIGIDSRWTGAYQPASKAARALVLKDRIEAHKSPVRWHDEHRDIQQFLFQLKSAG